MELKAGCALAATVVALAGCGEGESGGAEDAARQGSPPPEARLSKAQLKYVERLDQSYVESDRIRKRIGGIDPPPAEERFRRRYLAYFDRLDTLNKRARDAIARGEQLLGHDFLSLRRNIRRVTKQRGALVADHGGFRYCG